MNNKLFKSQDSEKQYNELLLKMFDDYVIQKHSYIKDWSIEKQNKYINTVEFKTKFSDELTDEQVQQLQNIRSSK